MLNRFKRGGFTLIELLLVIGIIAILASIVIVAINPKKQLADARNAQRRSDVNTLVNAFYQYSIDNNGNLQPTKDSAGTAFVTGDTCLLGATVTQICTEGVNTRALCVTGAGGNACVYAWHLTPTYLTKIPKDPQDTTGGAANIEDSRVDYTAKVAAGRLTIAATNAENSATITVER